MIHEISKELLDVIACPICKSDLRYYKKRNMIRCNQCKKNYDVKEGIPIFLP